MKPLAAREIQGLTSEQRQMIAKVRRDTANALQVLNFRELEIETFFKFLMPSDPQYSDIAGMFAHQSSLIAARRVQLKADARMHIHAILKGTSYAGVGRIQPDC